MQRLKDQSESVKESIRLGGRGFRPSKKVLQQELNRQTQQEKRETLMRQGEVDPSSTSAVVAMNSLNLTGAADFDDGIRAIKRGLRDVTRADAVALALQDEAITDHDRQARSESGVLNGLPHDVANLLSSDFQLLPHAFRTSLKHCRGGFPMVEKALGTNAKCKQHAYTILIRRFVTPVRGDPLAAYQ